MSSTPSPAVLTYFRVRGLSEVPRWLMAYAGHPFTESLVTSPDMYEELKASGKLAMNQVRSKRPHLEKP